jgi:hypothetical protein
MNIVYLVFGDNLENYQQVYFSIYTAFIHKGDQDKIIVITENVSLFQSFEDKIEVISIDRKIIEEWEGTHKFFWRVKIKALELIAQKYPSDPILYLDGDTFFFQNIDALRRSLFQGQNYMHINEGKLSVLPTKTEKLMWNQIKNKSYAGIEIDKNTCMWNAGLIGISNKHLECLKLTLNINDTLCADKVTRRLIEQFSFSVSLNEYSKLLPAEDLVGHYWGNKEQWNLIISDFLKECFMKDYSFEQIISKIQEMDLRQYPIWVRRSNTQKRLKNFIDSFYKDLKPEYVK